LLGNNLNLFAAAQPMLINIKCEGRSILAVVVATKMGHIFVLHRETGKPLFLIIAVFI
jgi:quinoprotein glucose dehydrogenase